MAMCQACTEIVRGKRGAPGHSALQETERRRGTTPIGQKGITITSYTCSSCGQKWEYEDDKNDSHVGWSTAG